VHSEFITAENVSEKLGGLDGLLVAPGFGMRGVEGKIVAVKYARENRLPFFGICLGMQMASIEFARNVLSLSDAHSTEMNPDTKNPVIDLMEAQKKITAKGGTMRLGSYPCTIQKDSLAYSIYGQENISERHRHRWEFNNAYLERFENAGMKASGKNPATGLVEIIELKDHPFFIGVQYHPELKSTVENPQPVFVSFVKAAKEFADKKNTINNPLLESEMI
jgi:CTP synthase